MMKKKVVGILLVTFVLMSAVASVLAAPGHSKEQLENAGWFCFPVEGLGWHCTKSDPFGPNPPMAINIKVFNEADGHFEGTELLIRADSIVENEPPCPTDEAHILSPWYACHHYDTTHTH
jgi:hypothetical protein